MASVEKDRYHRAGRDGYIDVLKEANRKDCNALDEDGMTPTIWCAYYGHLDALRVLIARGGDAMKCDHMGNTALHWAANNGHVNCVSFLVNFGTNLWSLNNDFHTAKDLAAQKEHLEILSFLDQVMAKQSAFNQKLVQKQKEIAVSEAEKRVKILEKLQKKSFKKADKYLQKRRKRLLEPLTAINSKLKSDSNSSLPSFTFSEIVNNETATGTKVNGIGGVSRKVLHKKQNLDTLSTRSDIKIKDTPSDSKWSVRSLNGLQGENEVHYVRKCQQVNGSKHSLTERKVNPKDAHHEKLHYKPNLKELFNSGVDDNLVCKKSNLIRTYSEPDFLSHFADSGIEEDVTVPPECSIFERPGFGSVVFRKNSLFEGSLLRRNSRKSLSIDEYAIHETSVLRKHCKLRDKYHKIESGSGEGSDSIGSVGSLAQRNASLSVISTQTLSDIDDNPLLNEVDHNDVKIIRKTLTPPIVLFLAANCFTEYLPLFQQEEIDLEALMLLTEDDLKSLGLPLGPRRKIMNAIAKRRIVQQKPGIIRDTCL